MIYLDNSATTFRKPKSVLKAMNQYMKHSGGNPGRGSHFLAMRAADALFDARLEIARLLSVFPERIALMPSATIGLNTVICGVLQKGDHAILTPYEHNAVLRPVHRDYTYDICDSAESAENHITPTTKLLIVNHASNVNGKIQPLQPYIDLARKAKLLLLVDASQSLGHIPFSAGGIDFVVCSGHKALFGPQGTAFLYVRRGIKIPPLVTGGTGILSESFTQPDLFPESLESGTQNGVGFAGLAAGVRFVNECDTDPCMDLNILLKRGLDAIPKVTLYSPVAEKTAPCVSFNIKDTDCVTVSEYLSDRHGICVRSGLHCAPLAHKTIGTLHCGTVRASLSRFNTRSEIEKFLNIIDSTPCFGV